uniref:hypothetical protein n=1 Tax=Sphingomonas asaccharolytica TaxID=40681 RepID=UPI000AD54CA8
GVGVAAGAVVLGRVVATGGGVTAALDVGAGVGVGAKVGIGVGRLNGATIGPDGGGVGVGLGLGGRVKPPRSGMDDCGGVLPVDCAAAIPGSTANPASNMLARFKTPKPLIDPINCTI